MHVLEIRNAELMESVTKQAAERGITYAAMASSRPLSGTLACPLPANWREHPR
jgi:hypothetical protein